MVLESFHAIITLISNSNNLYAGEPDTQKHLIEIVSALSQILVLWPDDKNLQKIKDLVSYSYEWPY